MAKAIELGTLAAGAEFEAADEQTRELEGRRVVVSVSADSCEHVSVAGGVAVRDGSDTLVIA